jgi:DNA-binding Lrp family transcriptional regulator
MKTMRILSKNPRLGRKMGLRELNILSHLRKNSRESLTSISRRTKIPVSTIFDKIKMTYQDLIVKYTALLDFSKLGFGTKTKILLKFSKEDRERARTFLRENIFVNSMYKVNNGYDFLLEGIFADLRGLEDFMEDLDEMFKLVKSEVYFVIEDIKIEDCLNKPEYIKQFIKRQKVFK